MSAFTIKVKFIKLEYRIYKDIQIKRFINKMTPEMLIQIFTLLGDNKTNI